MASQKGKTSSLDAAELRRRAEAQVSRHRDKDSSQQQPRVDVYRMLYELEVYQLELEMQNEELRRARQATEAGLERYTELFDFAPIGYATLGHEETIRELNHAGANLLGRPRAALIGQSLASFVALKDRHRYSAFIGQTLAREERQTCELEFAIHGNFAHSTLRLTAMALQRTERRILVSFEDITEERARERALLDTEQALREADLRKDEFLAVLSHELRNPLAPIRNSLYLLSHAQLGSEQSRRAQRIIGRQVTHLTRLIDDLLDVTRIRRGKIQLQRERVDFAALLQRTLDDHRASFDASGVLMESHIEAGAFWLFADPARVVQAVSNLLGNAEKFTPPGGTVVVSLWRQPGKAALTVRDNGAGISQSILKTLFEPFAQAPQTLDRARGGLGLGLAMVKGLVELHHGTVDVRSDGPGRGTEFTVILPLDTSHSQTVLEPVLPPSVSRRVLVIEDNPDTADTLTEVLALNGHVVQVAYDGATGLDLARTFHPEIVICDIGLPEMDGYAVAQAFRAEEDLKAVYLVALSGYAQPEDVRRASGAGFDNHIAKPPSLERLYRLLAEAPVMQPTT